jgi:uncharacterized membrane protein YgcG
MTRLGALVVACALAVGGCQPDTCSDIECVMNHLELTTSTGQRLELVEVPATMVPLPDSYTAPAGQAAGSFDLLIAPVSAPNFGDPLEMMRVGIPAHAGSGTPDEASMPTITNQPAAINLLFTSSEDTIEIDFEDPNGETPAFWLTPGSKGRPYPHCVWMSPAERDRLRSGEKFVKVGCSRQVNFYAEGFWSNPCGQLKPLKPPFPVIGLDGGAGDGGAAVPGAVAPIAGPPVVVPFTPPTPASAGGGLGGEGGGGGGGTGGGGGSGGGTCAGGGQLGSLEFCIQDGAGGGCTCQGHPTSMCITPAFWQMYFGGTFPPMCAPQGTACVANDGRTITTYCCPGLTCIGAGGPGCGAGQGTCQVH